MLHFKHENLEIIISSPQTIKNYQQSYSFFQLKPNFLKNSFSPAVKTEWNNLAISIHNYLRAIYLKT